MKMNSISPQFLTTLKKTNFFKSLPRINLQTRNSSYYSSKFLEDVEITTKYEATKNPEEWKYVERLLPPVLVPEPKKLPVYQSGWKPQGDDFSGRPYFVGRSRNHMMPVYLDISHRGVRRHTIITKIEGDIWQLEKEIRPFLENLVKPKPLRLQVDEFAGKIRVHGDHVNAVKYWLGERDF